MTYFKQEGQLIELGKIWKCSILGHLWEMWAVIAPGSVVRVQKGRRFSVTGIWDGIGIHYLWSLQTWLCSATDSKVSWQTVSVDKGAAKRKGAKVMFWESGGKDSYSEGKPYSENNPAGQRGISLNFNLDSSSAGQLDLYSDISINMGDTNSIINQSVLLLHISLVVLE